MLGHENPQFTRKKETREYSNLYIREERGGVNTSMRLEPRRDKTFMMLWPSCRVTCSSSFALSRFFLPPPMAVSLIQT